MVQGSGWEYFVSAGSGLKVIQTLSVSLLPRRFSDPAFISARSADLRLSASPHMFGPLWRSGNELAQELNADEREGLAKLLAMDINDMRDTHIEAVKARQMYLTDSEKARFPFLAEVKPRPKLKPSQVMKASNKNCGKKC
jgi:hypothetical protein